MRKARQTQPDGVEPQELRPLDPDSLGDHIDRLYRAAWGLCGSRHEAEDLVQETFARVLARPRLIKGESDLPYLLRALRRTWVDLHRARGRRPELLELDNLESLEARRGEDPAVTVEARAAVDAITGLPERFRLVIAAVDLAGLSYKETARSLRIPIGTVMSRLYSGRQQVARALGDEQ